MKANSIQNRANQGLPCLSQKPASNALQNIMPNDKLKAMSGKQLGTKPLNMSILKRYSMTLPYYKKS